MRGGTAPFWTERAASPTFFSLEAGVPPLADEEREALLLRITDFVFGYADLSELDFWLLADYAEIFADIFRELFEGDEEVSSVMLRKNLLLEAVGLPALKRPRLQVYAEPLPEVRERPVNPSPRLSDVKPKTVLPRDLFLDALCKLCEIDPSFFFPSDGAGVDKAKEFCSECEVNDLCLEYALERRIDNGVWGGASERERRRILRRRAKGTRTAAATS